MMIDWGNVPAGSTASIYWPEVKAQTVLALATSLYGTHKLHAADANTITCKTTKGVTYIPIPYAKPTNFAGLFTIDLPRAISAGQEFNVQVRRVTSRRERSDTGLNDKIRAQGFNAAVLATKKGGHVARNWRYVTGTFQVKIPVGNDSKLLLPEERTLSILKWRLLQYKPTYRWRPVLERLIAYVSRRVDGFGGNAAGVEPSPTGMPYYPGVGGKGGSTHHEAGRQAFVGKISAVIYDRFGDFEGFWLDTESGEHRFAATEHPVEDVVRRAWVDRILVRVTTHHHEPHRPLLVEYLRMSRHHGDQ
jgi:hypothetical protein